MLIILFHCDCCHHLVSINRVDITDQFALSPQPSIQIQYIIIIQYVTQFNEGQSRTCVNAYLLQQVLTTSTTQQHTGLSRFCRMRAPLSLKNTKILICPLAFAATKYYNTRVFNDTTSKTRSRIVKPLYLFHHNMLKTADFLVLFAVFVPSS